MTLETEHPGTRTRNAAELFRRGSFSECLTLLTDLSNDRDFALALRCLVRLDREREVIGSEILDRIAASDRISRITFYAIVGNAYTRLQMYDEAKTAFANARGAVGRMSSRDEQVLELDFLYAHYLIHVGELNRAREIASSLMRAQNWRMKALDLKSWILATRGDLYGQVKELLRALECEQIGEYWTRGAILHTLSSRIRELHIPQFAKRVIEEAEKIPWTREMATLEFYTFRNIGWLMALNARPVCASDYYHRAASVAQGNRAQQMLILA